MMHVNEISGTDEYLLGRLSDPADRQAWVEFASIYQSLVYRVAKRLGLQDADAENLVQEVIHNIGTRLSESSSPRPESGFRRWLSTVARNAALDVIRGAKPDAGPGGSSVQLALCEILESPQRSSDILFQQDLERQKFLNGGQISRFVTEGVYSPNHEIKTAIETAKVPVGMGGDGLQFALPKGMDVLTFLAVADQFAETNEEQDRKMAIFLKVNVAGPDDRVQKEIATSLRSPKIPQTHQGELTSPAESGYPPYRL